MITLEKAQELYTKISSWIKNPNKEEKHRLIPGEKNPETGEYDLNMIIKGDVYLVINKEGQFIDIYDNNRPAKRIGRFTWQLDIFEQEANLLIWLNQDYTDVFIATVNSLK